MVRMETISVDRQTNDYDSEQEENASDMNYSSITKSGTLLRKKSQIVNPVMKSEFFSTFRAAQLCFRLNRTPIWRIGKRNRLIKKLFGSIDGTAYCIQIPINCFWGKNIHVGKNFYGGFNLTILDHMEVCIGDNCFFAPNVTISTEYHPIHPDDRRIRKLKDSFEPQHRSGIEVNAPIKIGNDVYLASGVVVSAGVTIGDGCVIGAGSVVTRDIPPYSFACGVPCKVIRAITDEDRISDKINQYKCIDDID